MYIINFNQVSTKMVSLRLLIYPMCEQRVVVASAPYIVGLQYLKLERAFISFEVESVFGHRLISHLIFQLAELHVYLVPDYAWEENRGLAEKSVVEGCISLGFVR